MAQGFQLDPHVVLGVGPDASLDEIRDAYYQKSKKYHPDVGGDEWIFRIVARAYEILKATASDRLAMMPLIRNGHHPWPGNGNGNGVRDVPVVDPFRIVDVSVMWVHFEAGAEDGPPPEGGEPQEESLSGCLNITWPELSQTDRAPEIPDAAAILRNLIQVFETMRTVSPVTAARSRIEDGRFVGWLGYANGNRASAAFAVLSDALKSNGLGVKHWVRDLSIPRDQG